MRSAHRKILSAAVLWGMIPIFYHMMYSSGLSRMQTITIRFTLAALGYVIYLLMKDKELLRIKHWSHLRYFIGTGVCSLAAFNFCYITCIQYAGVAVAALLLYTAPIFVMLMSMVLFHEKLTGQRLAALGLTIFGCAFVSGMFSGTNTVQPIALVWGLASGFGYALYSIFSKFALKHYEPETITAYTTVFAALATLPLSEPTVLCKKILEPTVCLGGVGAALLCTILSYLLYTSGLSKTSASTAAILSTLEPVTAAILGALLLHESVSIEKICGIFLVLSAIIALNTPQRIKHGEIS